MNKDYKFYPPDSIEAKNLIKFFESSKQQIQNEFDKQMSKLDEQLNEINQYGVVQIYDPNTGDNHFMPANGKISKKD